MEFAQKKQKFFEELETRVGMECPCCEQHAQIYDRKINTGMVQALVQLYRLTLKGNEWSHFDDITKGKGKRDFTVLRFWGMIQAMPKGTKDRHGKAKKSSGFWRITEGGVDFIFARCKAPRVAVIYNDSVREFSPEFTTISQAVGSPFDYLELMDGINPPPKSGNGQQSLF